jgi:hypothetical protein
VIVMILVVVMCPGRGCDSGGQWGDDHDRVWTAVDAAIKELDPQAGHFPNEVPRSHSPRP